MNAVRLQALHRPFIFKEFLVSSWQFLAILATSRNVHVLAQSTDSVLRFLKHLFSILRGPESLTSLFSPNRTIRNFLIQHSTTNPVILSVHRTSLETLFIQRLHAAQHVAAFPVIMLSFVSMVSMLQTTTLYNYSFADSLPKRLLNLRIAQNLVVSGLQNSVLGAEKYYLGHRLELSCLALFHSKPLTGPFPP